jgi:hypothetical protein
MKASSLFLIVFITLALVVSTVLSVYYVISKGSAANIAGNIILLVCLFFFTWTALLLNRAKYSK